MTEIIYKKESYAIIGACFEVYNEKGCGFLEPVYQECLGIEFECQRIPAIAKPLLALSYRFEKIIVELKAVAAFKQRASRATPKLPARHRLRAWSSGEFWTLSKAGI
jgi:hypothetical protein